MEKLRVNLRSEEVKLVVIGNVSSWESVSQSISSGEAAVRVEIPSY